MVADLNRYRSHPDKTLFEHTDGVLEGTKTRCHLKIAELAAVFHDVGKLNPNFQKKLDTHKVTGYSNHAYLSAYTFLCYCAANQKGILQFLGQNKNWLASILAIIAHHHGNLPDYPHILKIEEYDRLLEFLRTNPVLPAYDFIAKYFPHNNFDVLDFQPRDYFRTQLQHRLTSSISNSLDYYLSTQFAFASLIAADKTDAGGYTRDDGNYQQFYSQYHTSLEKYVNQLSQTTELNRLRTTMRKEAIESIRKRLKEGKRVLSLTAPTGSGKTLMLLTLASEILKKEDGLRVIYAFPFLSIIEQVENECQKIFAGLEAAICRIDSKSGNDEFEKLQSLLDEDPTVLSRILSAQFAEDVFDYPFIVTTFVQVFETLVSNKNATLLKLPNFSNTIFLIDEIQALPPRLYGFFTALIDTFCRKFNSYAILSTATMPNFALPDNSIHNLKEFFPRYNPPPELLDFKYFQHPLFNRYRVHRHVGSIEIDELAELIRGEKESTLIILNTIQDTKDLYSELENGGNGNNCILLNTHFTLNDRKAKIAACKRFLEKQEKVILISTQLIEAGVDIDFPVVYRDFSPISSIVQSAGRCNRNGQLVQKGRVVLLDVQKNRLSRANLIYRGKDSRFLDYALENIQGKTLDEPEMFNLQKNFFIDIQQKTLFGQHYSTQFEGGELDFIQQIKEMKFAEIGKFKLIDEQFYGEEKRFYITKDEKDSSFEQLENLVEQLRQLSFKDFNARKIKLIEIENKLKGMSGNIVQVIIKQNEAAPLASSEPCCNLLKLSREYYDTNTGIQLSRGGQIL